MTLIEAANPVPAKRGPYKPYKKQAALGLPISFRRAFVDCGSNLCKVLESRIQQGLDNEFYAFEPQPELRNAASELKARYSKVKLHFEPKAVWISDEPLNFYLATKWGPNYKGGSTLMSGHARDLAAVDYSNPITVQGFDFSKWILQNFSPNDHVVVKMDIEGAEYPVLEKMCKDGSIELIDELIVEFHHKMNESIEKERHDRLANVLREKTKLVDWH